MSTVTNMCVRRKGRTDGDLCMRLVVEGVKMTIRQIKLILEQQASFPTLAMWTSFDTKSRARRHERGERARQSEDLASLPKNQYRNRLQVASQGPPPERQQRRNNCKTSARDGNGRGRSRCSVQPDFGDSDSRVNV